MAKILKESRAVYSVSLDKAEALTKPVVLKRAGRQVAALVPIAEYAQFVSWRKQHRPSRKRATKETWLAKQERIMNREFAAFEQMKPALLQSHKDKWVAIHNGELVDSDADDKLLLERVDSKFGDITMLVTRVTETERVYHVNSPKLVRQ